ncbi:helix-turn-helix domain-containing protein, partial [Pseudomonas aeruginosa]|nr:helix-turn-helix domain-containing protein [Pseudomonas aeruginosa]
ERRLERARQLLASPQGRRLDVAEVAYRHGFSSQAHFARAFKARYGMTPSEARGR